MGDHLGSKHFVFFSLAMIGKDIRPIRQIFQILLISLSFGKTQLIKLFSPGFAILVVLTVFGNSLVLLAFLLEKKLEGVTSTCFCLIWQ